MRRKDGCYLRRGELVCPKRRTLGQIPRWTDNISVREPTDDGSPVEITYKKDTDYGWLELDYGRDRHGNRFLSVVYARVTPDVTGQGIGTRLYEVAAAYACNRGLPLRSDTTRSEVAEAFWQKQRARGRARCIGGRGAVAHMDASPELRPGTPSPRTQRERHKAGHKAGSTRYWPCRQYELLCPARYLRGR